MNTQKINTRTVYAGDGTIKLIIPEHTPHAEMVRIQTIHDECQGLFDQAQQEVNQDLLCGKSTTQLPFVRYPSP